MQIDLTNEFLTVKSQLKSYLYRLTGNLEDTEDLIQDTYLKCQLKLDSFKGKSSFKTWMFAIATNLAKDNKRVQNRWQIDAQDVCRQSAMSDKNNFNRMNNSFDSIPDKRLEVIEHIDYCFTCVSKNLKLEQQISIILAEIYKFRIKEIAEILGKTEAAVKHFLFNARKVLNHNYEQRCALINKNGACYQCVELAEHYNKSKVNLKAIGLSRTKSIEENLDIRFRLIDKIDPLSCNNFEFENTLLDILRKAIGDQ